MQLKTKPIAASLAAATATLLGQSLPAHVRAQELMPWQFETAALYYAESNGRVKDYSFNVLARKEVHDEHFFDLQFGYDSLTGATPSGAVPTGAIHTYTTASGQIRQVAAGDIPLDDSFHDKRKAIDASYEFPVTRLTLFDLGVSWSGETDYTHQGFNFKMARDVNQRNTTISFGMAFANDTINPVGGTPEPMTIVTGADVPSLKLGDQTKTVNDMLLGVTQVINRHTIVQFNYGLSQSDGYQNDPYKMLSVVDPVFGDPVDPPIGANQDHLYYHENRPDTREKQSLYGLLKHDSDGNVFDISYRYMTDDWDIRSHTVDMHYRFNVRDGKYVQPHLRFYSQSAASFYRTDLIDGEPLPTFASADYRLSKLDAVTFGIGFGVPSENGEMSGRIEIYHQKGSPSSGSEVGKLRYFDLNPGFTALIGQFSYKFGG
jgi:Protein of unknown function (DUF3570)